MCIKKEKLNLKLRSTSNCKQNKSFNKNKIDVDSLKEFVENNKLVILKTQQQRSRSEKHNALTEEVNKIPLSSNNDKTIQLSDWMKPHAHGTGKDIICNKE